MTPPPPQVVLVNPPAQDVREPEYDHPRYPAIGIGYVAGYLHRTTGIRPLVIDGKLGRRTVDEVIRQVVALRPKVLGLTAMTHMVVTAGRIARAVKEASPGTATVLGGFHATFLPERTLAELPQFDYVISGEGEIAFTKLVQAVLGGSSASAIPGVALREGGVIRLNGRGEVPPHLDELGSPAWELFPAEDLRRYATLFPVMSQRGCPFRCNFCSRPYGNDVRARTPAKVVEEIARDVDTFGAKEIGFYDETFTVDREHVLGICEGLLARPPESRVPWGSMVHANTIAPDILARMREAGCTYLAFGVESGDETILKATKKGIDRRKILRAGDLLRASGIRWGTYFIFGHPNETRASCRATIDLAVRLNPDVVCFAVMVPYPGTEVFGLATRGEGGYRMLSVDWDDYNKQTGCALELVDLPRSVLRRFEVEGYLRVYVQNRRFKDLVRTGLAYRTLAFSKLRGLVARQAHPPGGPARG